MLKQLGTELSQARASSHKSLEAVAGPARISATYLQKLERGRVESPSPRVLARLADVLGIPYLELMQAAGYLDAAEAAQVANRPPTPHPLQDAGLDADEWRALAGFIKALKSRRTQR
jgi:transcriptional regulator with XRE-family HTH domain